MNNVLADGIHRMTRHIVVACALASCGGQGAGLSEGARDAAVGSLILDCACVPDLAALSCAACRSVSGLMPYLELDCQGAVTNP